MNRTGKIVLYVVYTIVAVFFFLFALFPSEIAKQLILAKVSQVQSEVELTFSTVRPIFPPGLKIVPVALAYEANPVLTADYLKVSPSLFSIFSSRKEFFFDGAMGGGSFKGRAELIPDDNRPQTKITLTLTDIPLESLEIAGRWPQIKPSGYVQARIDYDSRRGGMGSANVNTELDQVSLALNPAVMGIERLDFNKITGEITMTPKMLQIKNCEASGNQIDGRISGSIIFRQPIGSSRLTLSCTIKPQPTFIADHKSDVIGGLLASDAAQKRGIVFRISGTLDNPNYVIR